MDPLLRRFATGPRGRLLLVLAVVGSALVLAVAVLLAASGARGSEAELPTVAVERSPDPAPTPLLVQVSGAVRRPGLVSLAPGSRVVDAVAAAGGPSPRADEAGINLAAPVADGQQVIVPERGAAASAAAAPGAVSAKVAINSATAAQLEALPRIGPALAARIVAYRTARGAFRSVDELGEVGGIGPKILEGLRDQVTL